MSELPKAYVAKDHEKQIYDLWLKNRAFEPTGDGEPFSILMPPPNANESLHVGHVSGLATEDIMIRFARMSGKRTEWIPGTDHAGFETQVVYEKKLAKDNKSRFDFTPDQLRKDIYAYVTEQQTVILDQIKLLGASCDWSKLYFTLDKPIVSQVYKTFAKMHHDGLLYRAKRLSNYCVKHQTSFSDLEVVYEDRVGTLTFIKYPLADEKNQFIVVATTRPETMLGDTAVAVNPEDMRYRHLIGKVAVVPLVDRKIPIIADASVDPKFGTGAVKVTPAHSQIDNEIAARHNLDIIEVIDTNGKICGPVPDGVKGLKIAPAREWIVDNLKKLDLIEKITPHNHRVGVCYKCNTPIESLLIEQWWVKTAPLAKKAMEALRRQQITITPPEYKKHLVAWLDKIIDWNISRQVAWGIPIPAWINTKTGEAHVSETDTAPAGDGWVKDPDTFDTWFSSTQLPFAVINADKDLAPFFPTSVMETARDILYFWVGRMIMMSIYSTGEVPFKHIYLHGLVMDASGKKMSKSKGNVVDPIALIDKYGADALRWGVVHGTSAGQDFTMTESSAVGGRNLANKIWNASRFVIMSLDRIKQLKLDETLTPIAPESQAILKDLGTTVGEVTKCLNRDQYALATDLIFEFFWHRFCDQYLEQTKVLLTDPKTADETAGVLIKCLSDSLKLFHPFMPFVTETIWQELHSRSLVSNPLLISSPWPSK